MQKRKGKYVPGGFKLRPKRSSAGIGLYAGEDIPKGSCIIEYVGRRISPEEEYTSNSKYLFEVTKTITLDGKPKWNKAGYINHSCRPNAEPVISKQRVFIMARRNIKEGEEIAYDYGKEYWKDHCQPCRCAKCAGN
jgi:uncharacterized protein